MSDPTSPDPKAALVASRQAIVEDLRQKRAANPMMAGAYIDQVSRTLEALDKRIAATEAEEEERKFLETTKERRAAILAEHQQLQRYNPMLAARFLEQNKWAWSRPRDT